MVLPGHFHKRLEIRTVQKVLRQSMRSWTFVLSPASCYDIVRVYDVRHAWILTSKVMSA
jgi:hypothetical protein